jgi:glucose/arabinose dehydrogenase
VLRWRPVLVVLGLIASVTMAVPQPVAAATVPSGFADALLGSVSQPTALTAVSDGRLLVASKTGEIRVIRNGVIRTTPILDISSKVCSNQERGLLGLAADRRAGNNSVYAYYTAKGSNTSCPYGIPEPAGAPRGKLVKFTLNPDDTMSASSEVTLLDGVLSARGIHEGGDVIVDRNGYVYLSVGDGSCDYLGTNPATGGSGCGGLNDASRDRNILNGKILRVTDTGGIPIDNPFLGSGTVECRGIGVGPVGTTCREVYAMGLRNPYRMAFNHNTSGSFYINDVGQENWEEINRGTRGADYGWNVREGMCQHNGSPTNCGTPTPSQFTDPIHDYSHQATGCGSITGGAFVPTGAWPASYDGAYIFGDYVCGTIFTLSPSGVRTPFATGLGSSSAVAMAFGTDNRLYYTTFNNGGQVRRITYAGAGNRAPSAVLNADPTAGDTPLTVSFNATGSTDPDGDALTYRWDFGDGSAPVTTSASTSHLYSAAGTFTATVTVSDGRLSDTASVVLRPGDTAPVITFVSPSESQLFTVGRQYTLSASATDEEDGDLPTSALSWTVLKHHHGHVHPFLGPVSGNNIVITAPEPEDLDAATDSYLEIRVTATDSGGASTTAVRNLNPQKVPVTIASSPTGRTVELNGQPVTTPITVTSWVGYGLALNVPPQTDASGTSWSFVRWSDDGAAAHTYVTTAAASTLTATLAAAQNVPRSLWAAQTGSGRATLAWSPPAGGPTVTGYRISRDGPNPWSATVAASARTANFTSLTSGTTYRVSVQAVTAGGAGTAVSVPVTITPWVASLPSAPQQVTVAVTSNTATRISWQPSASTGGRTITGYRVSRDGTDSRGAGPYTTVVSASTRSFTMNSLVSGIPYRLSVQAITSAGTGPAGTAAAIAPTATNPSAPAAVTAAVVSTGRLSLTWQPPATRAGKTVTGYIASRDATDTRNAGPWSSAVLPATARSQSFTSLISGYTYTLSVVAVFSDGSRSQIATSAARTT